MTQAVRAFRPRSFAVAAVGSGLAIEIVLPLAILTGVADCAAALAMAGYCATTSLLVKRFWEAPRFWSAGASPARDLFWHFTKNLSVGPDGLMAISYDVLHHDHYRTQFWIELALFVGSGSYAVMISYRSEWRSRR